MATEANKPASQNKDQQKAAAPSISLPKGGGAIRGIGEKFAANPVTGTGSMSVPIATSPGRSGFGPQLSLSYDSGSGNGPFGFGWSLSLPSITRKTDKGLPQYFDAEESDIFILSGAEDLVPELLPDGSRFEDTTTAPGYTIHRYRPRVEGLFARIERWTFNENGDIHWRSISRDNILTLYGKNANSRIADPSDQLRVFSWLICETRDDKGNAVLYKYKAEDGLGVDLSQAHERNRGDHANLQRTANRYLKHIVYGNRTPLLDDNGRRPRVRTQEQLDNAAWMFEVVFDYGEHDAENPSPGDAGDWTHRADPFSTYRAGFEVRTARLCQRVLMFHHFPGEEGVGRDCLVRSTDFTYSHEEDPTNTRNPVYTFLVAVTQSGYKRSSGGYLKRSLPPLEYEYTQPVVQDVIHEIDPASLENLPIGVDEAAYQWTDLHGEGIPGILTEQADAWFYKRNISPISQQQVEFAPVERVAIKPNVGVSGGGAGGQAQPAAQFMDLAGDGQPDLVVMNDPMPGLYEHDEGEGWKSFRPFPSRLYRDMRDPNLKLVDLDGDGHADVLISEHDAFIWHASLAEEGFSPARRVQQALDEEKGARLVFADGTESIYLADMSGDGLTDLVRIRNGEVCYWPNLGYCRFGAKVDMDNAPHFDRQEQFEHKRIRLADIDGSGTTDIIYLHQDGVRLYFNQSGNSWGQPQSLPIFPRVDELVNIHPTDLLGNGTACLVWSSPLPGDARQHMRYVDLMGGQKPHLLVKSVNNLGAETRVHYASSTKFYLQDKHDGRPWITRLPFPVHVVERVETYDHISRNRFVTRYAYHHGYFDGVEREFHGFGTVEQWDTEEFATLTEGSTLPEATNIDLASHVPPVHTKTWFHTGIYVGRDHVSDFFAGLLNGSDKGEYYREPGLSPEQARERLLPDTVMPIGLTLEEEREACRALKGSMLRQEVYALDGSTKEKDPYTVTEQNFAIQVLQRRGQNRYGVFLTHARESINHHYERNPVDPRHAHVLTLEVDNFGNVLKQAAVAYGRRQRDPDLTPEDQAKQTQMLITYTENRVTNPIDAADEHRTPLPCETHTYQLTGVDAPPAAGRLTFTEVAAAGTGATAIDYEQSPADQVLQKRLIEHDRIYYRPDDLGAAAGDVLALLPLGIIEPLALPGESYKLAFTPGLIASVYDGRVSDAMLETEGRYVHTEGEDDWWIPSGRVFLSPGSADTPAQELAHARQHFFLPHRYRDPFHTDTVRTETVISYAYDLLLRETRDALDNRVTVGERDASGTITREGNDYRVLQPWLMSDPNRNRTAVAFDVLGMVAGTAVMGKPVPGPAEGDTLESFLPDLDQGQIDSFFDAFFTDQREPITNTLLAGATTRIIYDVNRYYRLGNVDNPTYAATLARETHLSNPIPLEGLKIQVSFSYSDGFGREIQKKIQAEPGPVVEDGPVVSPRWVGSGWTIFNNKGKPVRQYEPFFDDTHDFRFGKQVGVSPVLFYDPVERVVGTLHPNHTWEKVVSNPWRNETWDVNDTVLIADPKTDPDVGDFFRRLPEEDYLPTWYAQRESGALGPQEQAAALKTAVHATTPTVTHADSLGRSFLTVAHNKYKYSDIPLADPIEAFYRTRIVFDIEGNQREVIDANGRIAMRYDYDMLGTQIHSTSMEAGERWVLNDVAGNLIYAWDSRNHRFHTVYDPLRRPTDSFLREGEGRELLVERTIYGETQPDPETSNLRGKVVQLFDQAGVVTTEEYDFKGNLLRSQRQLAVEYKTTLDWAADVSLEADIYMSRTRYDALNRSIQLIVPHSDQPDANINIIQPIYNEANLLEEVHVWLDHGSEPEDWLDTTTANFHAVTNIDYDAKGQRTLIEYGNGASTAHRYDELTFRLIRLTTTRPTVLNGLATQLFKDAGTVQDLNYTYDPAGNITRIADDALPRLFFANQQVEPVGLYTYDAVYRLIEAQGRESIGQSALQLGLPQATYRDYPYAGLGAQAFDPQAVRNYTQRYHYDAVGNFLRMIHQAGNGAWQRDYRYEANSLIEPGKFSNRLSETVLHPNGNQPLEETYTHDAHGNMTVMLHLTLMQWDFNDQLRATARQVVNEGTPETTYYVYDAAGQRVRKVTERQNGTRKDERTYLGGFEVYRKYGGDGTSVSLERESLHVMDDQQRIALVETRTTRSNDGSPEQLIRYQLGNHLGSASLELDGLGQVISYEEYHPYGSTSYQAWRSRVEVSLKRYRYTGKERDEETGFSYHGARYYAVWLARWLTCDPLGMVDGANPYTYSDDNPVQYRDLSGLDSESINPLSDDDLLNLANENPIHVSGTALHRFDELWSAKDRGLIHVLEPREFEAKLQYEIKGGSSDYSESWTEEERWSYAQYTTDQSGILYDPQRAADMAESKWSEFVNRRYSQYLQGRAADLEQAYRRMEAAGRVGNAIGLGTVMIVTAGFGVASPTFGAVYGGYETGVSTVEAITGKSSGVHVMDLASGNIDPGRELSTWERVLRAVEATVGWAGMRRPSASASSNPPPGGGGGNRPPVPPRSGGGKPGGGDKPGGGGGGASGVGGGGNPPSPGTALILAREVEKPGLWRRAGLTMKIGAGRVLDFIKKRLEGGHPSTRIKIGGPKKPKK
ncbi:SpvB/TcaC N-terminal domain-containing protein [Nitrosospira multiformis]|uniref:RHS repeat-associated core domain-containing protein n=1 Tax=Nitrosospira multiformis TaxID=1231 RepID=A0A1I7FT03_9PROT|nr:SpvB/TcaC N-terminal domain-containing protein [Nitrosospira multiformis]SFU39136.1 RHS repeat-associated core domain-containing protein [Nitrosospira multiformis]